MKNISIGKGVTGVEHLMGWHSTIGANSFIAGRTALKHCILPARSYISCHCFIAEGAEFKASAVPSEGGWQCFIPAGATVPCQQGISNILVLHGVIAGVGHTTITAIKCNAGLILQNDFVQPARAQYKQANLAENNYGYSLAEFNKRISRKKAASVIPYTYKLIQAWYDALA